MPAGTLTAGAAGAGPDAYKNPPTGPDSLPSGACLARPVRTQDTLTGRPRELPPGPGAAGDRGDRRDGGADLRRPRRPAMSAEISSTMAEIVELISALIAGRRGRRP